MVLKKERETSHSSYDSYVYFKEFAPGSLMYLMICTRPDISYAVSIMSKYLANPGKNHWEAVKWILKYLKGTANVGLVYGRDQGKHVDIDGFVDADYAKDPDKDT
ncbi:hypothetical protein Tco_1368115 [Tanacetum coccineum]